MSLGCKHASIVPKATWNELLIAPCSDAHSPYLRLTPSSSSTSQATEPADFSNSSAFSAFPASNSDSQGLTFILQGRPTSLHSPLVDRITVGVSTLFLTCSCSLKDQEDCLFPLLIHATNIYGQPVQSYLKKICNEIRQSGKYDHIRFSLWGHFRFPYRHPDIPNIRLHTHI